MPVSLHNVMHSVDKRSRRCGCNIPRIILLQAYVYTYSLLRGSRLKYSPSAAMHLA